MNQQTTIANRFTLEQVIGYGSMGEVYRARDRQTGSLVAVKRLKPELVANDTTFIDRFLREGEALRRLNHPNIIRTFGSYTVGEEHYLVMEYVSGGSLAALLQGNPHLPIEHTLKIALDLADALNRAHSLNIIHRDLKPENVLLTKDGRPILTDFGAAHIEQATQLTRTGMVIGTYAYMSPEACNGDLLDARTDIWSFGVLLYEMLTGKQPFNHPHVMQLFMAIMTEPPPDLQQLRPEVSDSLADLVYRMLAKDRDLRIPTARLVGAELEAIITGAAEETRATRRAPASERFALTAYSEGRAMRHGLPLISTPFVGREDELTEIHRLLTESPCRLLTLLGPGGTGKTRLAIQAALGHLEQFEHGVYFVDLTSVENGALICPTIAAAIRFHFFGPADPEAQLLNYLQNKEMLLVLDNFEQLMEQAEFIYKILNTAPEVRLLVTSRERLNLREEWVLPLEGLPVPEDIKEAALITSPSVGLFLQSVRRIRPNYTPTDAEWPAIRRICQLVDGLPLGIELAASWINTLTTEEIAAEINRDFGFLTANLRDVPVRHRSLRSVSEYSWKLLDNEQKQAMRQLSVFRRGFDRPAVRSIVGASLPTLNALIDKSLLRRSPTSGRYEMQEMLRQFAAEKLAQVPEVEADTYKRHASYYLHYLQQREADLVGGQQLQALSEIDTEIDNIRIAWQRAVTEGDWGAVASGLDALYYFYQLRGRQREGVNVLAQAAQALRATPNEQLLLVRVLARQGAYSRFVGRFEESKALLQESLQIARKLNDRREIAFILYHLGAADPSEPAANDYWEESLSLAQEIGDRSLQAEALNWLAFANYRKGYPETAVQLLQDSLNIRRALGDQHGLAIGLTNLGLTHIHLGKYDKAQAFLQEGLQAYRQLNDLHGIAAAYNNLSYTALNIHDYEAAQHWGEQALAYFREVGDKKAEGEALGNLSEAAFFQQDYERAKAICRQSIALYEEIGLSTSSFYNDLARIALAENQIEEAYNAFRRALAENPTPPLTLVILTGISSVMIDHGELEKAAALLTFVTEHPLSEQALKERAATQLAELAASLTPQQMDRARLHGREKSLEEWVELVNHE